MTRPAAPDRQRLGEADGGFSMLETVAALFILSLTSLVALPHLVSVLDNARMERTAMQAVTLMRHERNVAMRTGRLTLVIVDPAQGRLGFSSSGAVVDFGRAIGLSVPAGHASSIAFMPDGSSSGGALAFRGRAATYRIMIGETGGAVTARRLAGGAS